MKKKMLAFLMAVIIVVGMFPITAMAENPVAKIGDTEYATLADAIGAVKDNETITMVADVVGAAGISVGENKNFTVDFADHTYTVNKPGAGSTNTQTQAFQLLKGSTITFRNGTIQCATENKNFTWVSSANEKGIAMLIQNYCDLTLDNMTIDGTNIAHNGNNTRYVVSNNCGTTTIKDSGIIAVDGDFAFDSCKSGSYSVPTVNVEDSTINGKVEASGGAINFKNGTTVNGQVRVGENKESGATGSVVTIEKGATVNNEGNYAVVVFRTNTLNVEGTVKGLISTNGNAYNGGSIINIKDGATVTEANDVAIYMPNGELNISGGIITGKTAVYFKSTKLNITGGTLIGNGEDAEYVYSGNGCNATGDALVIDSCNYPNGLESGNVSITGGTFKSTNANAVGSYAGNGQTDPLTSFITGGTFSSKPDFDYLAEGYFSKAIETGKWQVMPMEVVVKPAVVGEGGNITVGGENVEVEGAGEGEGKPSAQEAAYAITNTLATEAVYAFENTKIENATKGLKITDLKGVTEGTIEDKQVNVKLKSVKVEGNNTAFTITKMEFDVKPVAVVTKPDGSTTEEDIPNNKIKALITFRLPVDSNVDATTVAVYHKGDEETKSKLMGTYPIQTVGTGSNTDKFIEVQSKEFSTFAYELLDENNAIARIGEPEDKDYFASLAEAVAEVGNGETITILNDTDEVVTVKRNVKFILADDAKLFTGDIKAGEHYKKYKNGNEYTFKYYETGDTIVIGGNKDKEKKPDTTKEENPETGAPVMSMGALVVLAAAYVATRKH